MAEERSSMTRREYRDQSGFTPEAKGGNARSAMPPGSGSSPSPSFPHFSAIDGARGVAILSVLLYHSGWSTRGLFGVDMFFVVSGFLITFLLIREASGSGRISIGAFYARRAKRLLPPLVIALGLTLLAVWRWGTLSDLENAGNTAIASLLQVANWFQIVNNTAYWEASGQIVPLGQMWSLSMTEQFYIIWPLLLTVLWVAARRRLAVLAWMLSATFVVAAAVSPFLFDGTNTDRLYLGTDARAVSFVAGGLFAAIVSSVLHHKPRWATENASLRERVVTTTVSSIALGIVVTASVATSSYHEPWLYLGGFAVISVAIAVFVASLCVPGNALARPLSWKPLRVVGTLAYGMFLLHLPVFWVLQTFADGSMPGLALFVVGGVITWLIATVVHYVLTEPLRLRAWRPVGATLAIALSFSVIAATAWFLPLQRQSISASVTSPVAGVTDAFSAPDAVALPDGVETLRVAVVGDSVAGNMATALREHASASITTVDFSFGGCGLFDAEATRALDGWTTTDVEQLCWPWKQKLRAAISEDPFDVIIVHNRFDAHDQMLSGTWVTPGDPAWDQQYHNQLESLLELGDQQPQPPRVLLLNDFPTDDFPAERLKARDQQNTLIAASHPTVSLVDYAAARCPGGRCPTVDSKGSPLYSDGTHFTAAGMSALAPWLESHIIAAVRADQ